MTYPPTKNPSARPRWTRAAWYSVSSRRATRDLRNPSTSASAADGSAFHLSWRPATSVAGRSWLRASRAQNSVTVVAGLAIAVLGGGGGLGWKYTARRGGFWT